MSFISWLDYSESSRRKMLDVISLFQQKESRDELGIGTVRDAFADIFFPGTSTIQTRARYFMFIPWIYMQLEKRNYDAGTIGREARKREYDLIEALIASGEDAGVIGKVARRSLQRLPSNIYWSGMHQWKILNFNGSQEQYHRWFENKDNGKISLREMIEDPEGNVGGLGKRTWNSDIPKIPEGFPVGINFKLGKEEARFLKDQVLRNCSKSLLSFLLLNGRTCEDGVDFAWQHPQYNEFDDDLKEQLEHARCFSDIMNGAAWLYNLMLAEAVERTNPKDTKEKETISEIYRKNMAEWYNKTQKQKVKYTAWDIKRFWEIATEQNPYIPGPTKTFCMKWIEYAISDRPSFKDFADNPDIRTVIKERERVLKRENARLSNSKALENWGGDSGTGQLDYRWHISRTIINDILTGLSQGDKNASAQ